MTSTNSSATKAFEEFCATIAALRHPKTGCPWDLEQTHSSLRKYMIEEAYEAAEVMDSKNPGALQGELGDVLLQVVLNSQVATDAGEFSIDDVIRGINSKMIRRHPHVFGTPEQRAQKGAEDIRTNWEAIKRGENAPAASKTSLFSDIKPSKLTPALLTSVAIGKIAHKINFDWSSVQLVFEQVKSEVNEVAAELQDEASIDKSRVSEEIGDLLFSIAQLCRHLDIDPEVCALDGNKKFLGRFKLLEDIAVQEGIDVRSSNPTTLEGLWNRAKVAEKHKKRP